MPGDDLDQLVRELTAERFPPLGEFEALCAALNASEPEGETAPEHPPPLPPHLINFVQH